NTGSAEKMGHKDDLLEGAKRCLIDIGYARTTARDIVGVSGTNLASIGYHFGSKDALMMQAMMAMMEEWGERFMPKGEAGSFSRADAKFSTIWTRLLTLFESDRRLLMASFEAFVEAERNPQLRQLLAGSYATVRDEFGADFLLIAEELTPSQRRAVGSVLLALLSGMMAQYLMAPEGMPTGEEITLAFKII